MLVKLGRYMCPTKTPSISEESGEPETGDLSALNPEWELLPANYDSGSGKYLNSVASPASGAAQSDYDATPVNSITVSDGSFVYGTGARLDQVNTTFMNELHHYDSTNFNIGHPWTIFMRGNFTISNTVFFFRTKGGLEGVRMKLTDGTNALSGDQENGSSQSRTFSATNTMTTNTDTTLMVSWDPTSGTMRCYVGDQSVDEFDPLWYDANGTAQSNNQIWFSPGTTIKSIGMLRHFINDEKAETIKSYLNSL